MEYKFKVAYTTDGVGTAPSSAPVCTVVDADDNVLANAQATTALANLTGVYLYSYTGATGLDLVALFHTTDDTVDTQDLYSYTSDLVTTNIDTVLSDIVGADGDSLETLSDQLDGQEPADVWGYGTRTLTQSAASVAAAVSGDSITIIRGDTASISITDLGSLVNRSKLYFTVKRNTGDIDTESLIMVEESDGLLYANGEAASSSSDGSLVVDDEDTGDITVTVAASITALLDLKSVAYDIQIVRSSGIPVTTLAKGDFNITLDITKATS